MRKLLKRWYVWLGLVLLLGFAGSVALICPGRGRITQANFDRIQEGILAIRSKFACVIWLGLARIIATLPASPRSRTRPSQTYQRLSSFRIPRF